MLTSWRLGLGVMRGQPLGGGATSTQTGHELCGQCTVSTLYSLVVNALQESIASLPTQDFAYRHHR